jgi:hypothetical protein
LAAVHLAGNALLLFLGYYWLGVGESRALTLLWSAILALLLISLTCWLHSGTFAFFASDERTLPAAFRTAARHLLPLIAVTVALLVLYQLVSRLADYSSQPAFQIASWLTLKLRKPIKPSTVQRVFNAGFWLIRWVLIPVPLLPMIAGVAVHGWAGFGQFGKLAGRRLYWLEAPVLLLAALWAPLELMGWVPTVGSFTMEIVSFSVRLLVAYLLFVGSWLLLAFLTSAGKPVLTQSKTAVSP